jgi:hypothetical protein
MAVGNVERVTRQGNDVAARGEESRQLLPNKTACVCASYSHISRNLPVDIRDSIVRPLGCILIILFRVEVAHLPYSSNRRSDRRMIDSALIERIVADLLDFIRLLETRSA